MRVAWWLVCMIASPLAALFSDEKLELLLSKATLKPRNEIEDARDAFELGTVPVAHYQRQDNEDLSD